MGETERAVAELARVIAAAPHYGPAREDLVGILRPLNRVREAIPIFAEAADRNPACRQIRQALDRLRRDCEPRRNNIHFLDSSVFSAQDVIPVLLGDKPAAYNDCTEQELAFIPRWAKQLGLHAVNIGRRTTTPQHDGKERYGVLLAKERGLAEKTAKLWGTSGIEGELLGYPPCCVAAFKKYNRLQLRDRSADVIPFIAAESGAGPYSFLLNTMMVFHSRRCIAASGKEILRLFRINAERGESLKLKAVISWHPCSFKCRRSLALARRTWSYLTRSAPDAADALKERLDKPMLYFKWSKFAAFEGRVERRSLFYSRITPPYSFLSAKNLELFKAGDAVRLAPDGVQVYRDKVKLGGLPADSPKFLPFSSRTS